MWRHPRVARDSSEACVRLDMRWRPAARITYSRSRRLSSMRVPSGEWAWARSSNGLGEADASAHEDEEGGGKDGGGDGEWEVEGEFECGRGELGSGGLRSGRGGGRFDGALCGGLAEVGEGEEEAEGEADGAGEPVVEDEAGADGIEAGGEE